MGEQKQEKIIKVECSCCDNEGENTEAYLKMLGWYLNDEEIDDMDIMCPGCYYRMCEGEKNAMLYL